MSDSPVASDPPLRIGVTEEVARRSRTRIASAAPGSELVLLRPDGTWAGDPSGLDGFFLSEDLYYLPQAIGSLWRLLEETPPGWLQTASTGVDHEIYAALLASGRTITNAPGVHGGPIAEYVFAHILDHAKRIPQHRAAMAERAWRPLDSIELAGQTIGIVGYGGIGEAIASRAQAFGMRAIATKRRPPQDDALDLHLTPDQLPQLLRASDYVVLCCPLTDETLGLIGPAELASMRPSALLINVARGRVVQHDALAAALTQGRIAGAVLDVAPVEPLTPESPLWDMPNCLMTPHDSCHVDASFERTTDFFLQNLSRLARGEALQWVVADTELSQPSSGDV